MGKVYFIPSNAILPHFESLESVGTIYTNPLFIGPNNSSVGYPGILNRFQWFAIDYTGKIYIRNPGQYTFHLISDDGSRLYIDDKVLIDNDHGLGVWTGDTSVVLSGGMHTMRLSYFQGPVNHHYIELRLTVTAPGRRSGRPFNLNDFRPPGPNEPWTYGTPLDFMEPPEPATGRVKLKDAVALEQGAGTKTLVELVQTSLQSKTSDETLASKVDQFLLSQKLDLATVEALQSEGIGPQTLASLYRLSELSIRLPPPQSPAFPVPLRPSIPQQRAFFQQLSRNAMHYADELPPFICFEVVRATRNRRTSPPFLPPKQRRGLSMTHATCNSPTPASARSTN